MSDNKEPTLFGLPIRFVENTVPKPTITLGTFETSYMSYVLSGYRCGTCGKEFQVMGAEPLPPDTLCPMCGRAENGFVELN